MGQFAACTNYQHDACIATIGCTWFGSSCIPNSTFCSSNTRRPDCDFFSTMGCSWRPSCTGTTATCASLGELACEADPGCVPGGGTSGGTCVGTPPTCRNLSGTDCGSAAGCYTVVSCSGYPLSCGANGLCDSPGCFYNGSFCDGVPQPCAYQLDERSCQSDRGCRWGPVCVGTALTCDKLKTQATCQAQSGCSWQPQ
ncbi:MAG TPA: hypothetical protein VIF57_14890, partial [Polyangia bacterium]